MNIKELAEIANVSVATISRCINTPERVAPKTREYVNSIIEKYGYTPNPSAQMLSTGTTRIVACLVPNLNNEFFTQMVGGAQEVLAAAGYKTLVSAVGQGKDILSSVDVRIADGLVISGIAFQGSIGEAIEDLSIPVVVIDHPDALGDRLDVPSVYIQDDDGILRALEFLYNEGNRRIGILLGNESDKSILAQRRIRTMEAFFKTHPEAICIMEYGHYTNLEISKEACERMLCRKDRPTAIFAVSDMIALGAHNAIMKRRLRMPDEIELIGFDDIPLSAYFTPAMSTVAAPNRELGSCAAQMLLKRLSGNEEAEHKLLPVELKLRQTTRNIHLR